MNKKIEVVSGLKVGNSIFNVNDEIVFKIKEDPTAYAARLYDLGQKSFTAFGDDGTEYNFAYEDLEMLSEYEPETVRVKIISSTGTPWYSDEIGNIYNVDKANVVNLGEDCFAIVENGHVTRKCIACCDCEEI